MPRKPRPKKLSRHSRSPRHPSFVSSATGRPLRFEPLEPRRLLAADFGDAPAPYPTLLEDDGPQHMAVGPQLGPTRGTQDDGQPSPGADADVADDGVTFGTVRVGQLDATLTVNVQGGPGKLDAWIDFSGDGNWGLAGEQIFVSRDVAQGDNLLAFDVPAWALAGETVARFRLSTEGGLNVKGEAADGEVEDYRVTISPSARTVGAFDDRTSLFDAIALTTPKSMATADIDGDGDLDLVTATQNSDRLAWYENMGDEGFAEHLLTEKARRVVIADMNRDGDLDLVVWWNGSLYWYANDESHSFSDKVLISGTLSGIVDFDVADVNGDGRFDVAAATSVGAIYWFENFDYVSFSRHVVAGIPTISRGLQSIAIADGNADGQLDVYVAGSGIIRGGVSWYHQTANGTFVETAVTNRQSYAAVPVDIDLDGDIDVLSYYADKLYLYRNDGAHSFVSTELFDTLSTITGFSQADFDGDGDLDLVVDEGGRIHLLRNQGAATFSAQEYDTSSAVFVNFSVGDLDGNGTVDLITNEVTRQGVGRLWLYSQPLASFVEAPTATSEEGGSEPIRFRLYVDVPTTAPVEVPFVVSGLAMIGVDYTLEGADSLDGTAGIATIPAGSSYVDLLVWPLADDSDETTESIVITVGATGASALGVILGDPAGGDYGDAPAPYPTAPLEQGPGHLATGPTLGPTRGSGPFGVSDANADGDAGDDGVSFGTIQIGKLNSQLTVNVQNASGPARLDAWIDFNGDGSWGGADEQIFRSIEVMPGENVLTFATPAEAAPGVTYARFRLSTEGGLSVTGEAADGEVEDYAVEIAPPLEGFSQFSEVEISSGEYLREAIAVDFDRDGDMDVLALSLMNDEILWFEQSVPGEYIAHVIEYTATLTTWFDLQVADLDGDGDLDVVAATHRPSESGADGRLYWFRNDDFQFTRVPVASHFISASSAYVADIDADGDFDIVAPTYSNFPAPNESTLAWYENDGSGVFTRHNVASGIGILRSTQTIDLDRDGDLDILTSESGFGGIIWYENDGQQSFALRRVTDLLPVPYSVDRGLYVHAADLDQDGDFDLVAAAYSESVELLWYEQTAPGDFVARTIAPGLYRSREVTTADMDGDGDLDLVFADLRKSGVYTSWAENRLLGDYNDDGMVDPDDYLFWKTHFGATEGEGLRADGNGDGIVNAADYIVWRNQLGNPQSQRSFVLHAGPVGTNYVTKPADMDGDGDLDLLALVENRLIWLKNGPPEPEELAATDTPAALTQPVTHIAPFTPTRRRELRADQPVAASSSIDTQRLDLLLARPTTLRAATRNPIEPFTTRDDTAARGLLAIDEAFSDSELAPEDEQL